jgi:hypothetical protein
MALRLEFANADAVDQDVTPKISVKERGAQRVRQGGHGYGRGDRQGLMALEFQRGSLVRRLFHTFLDQRQRVIGGALQSGHLGAA